MNSWLKKNEVTNQNEMIKMVQPGKINYYRSNSRRARNNKYKNSKQNVGIKNLKVTRSAWKRNRRAKGVVQGKTDRGKVN